MKNFKKASVFVYTLFLISIALLMGLVILNLSIDIFNNNEYQNIIRKLSNNISYKANLAFKYSKILNSNGSGYIDVLSCPSSVTMSWNTLNATFSTSLSYTGSEFVCSWTYSSTGVNIYFNDVYTAFSGAIYTWLTVGFTGGVYNAVFSDVNNTRITFVAWWAWVDQIDDNANSDNYRVTSTGSIYYPSWREDDDVLARKTIYFYLPPWGGLTNIFWSNNLYNNYIKSNSNNTDIVNRPVWDATSANLFIDVDKDFSLQIVRFDKAQYTNFKELVPTQVIKSNQMFGRLWFIQNNGNVSTWWLVKTWQEMVFDFVNHDYALFLTNFSTWTLFFNLKGYTTTWSWLYINPINDTDTILNRFLGNDIIIDSDKRYISNQFEVIDIK